MSPRLRIWGACRALAIRSRPAAPRTTPFVNSISHPRWYSNDGDNLPPNPIANSNDVEKPQSEAVSKENDAVEEVPAQEGAEVGIGI
jgi:small subunit ribosomal protein S7